jgi:hypothetical protein
MATLLEKGEYYAHLMRDRDYSKISDSGRVRKML